MNFRETWFWCFVNGWEKPFKWLESMWSTNSICKSEIELQLNGKAANEQMKLIITGNSIDMWKVFYIIKYHVLKTVKKTHPIC